MMSELKHQRTIHRSPKFLRELDEEGKRLFKELYGNTNLYQIINDTTLEKNYHYLDLCLIEKWGS